MNETTEKIINMLINKIFDLEKEIDEVRYKKNLILDYLHQHNITLNYNSEKITSELDERKNE